MDQITSLAVLMDWLHQTEGVPYKTAEKLDDSGLGYHRMFGKGDHVCPGSKVVAQRENILRLTDCGI